MENNLLPGTPESVWVATTPSTDYPKLMGNVSADVAVVGGGLAGITTAYFLTRLGLQVVLVEAERIGTGTSGYTTAKVTSLHGLIYGFLLNTFGFEKAKIYADSNEWAIGELERIITNEKIECNFARDDSFTFTNEENKIGSIQKEAEAAKELGLPASFEENMDLLPFPIRAAVQFQNQALFHPRKFILALAEIIIKHGGQIFEKSRVTAVEEGTPSKIETGEGKIEATDVVIATNYPVHDKAGLFLRMNQMRSYAYALAVKDSLPQGMYLGAAKHELSIRPLHEDNHKWLIIGGQDHPVGEGENATARLSQLKNTIEEQFPNPDYEFRWAAQDSSPIDRVPYIGRQKDHLYVITGFNEWGMTKSILSAKLIADLIQGNKNDWADFYSPSRISVKASMGKIGQMGKHVLKGYGSHITKTATNDVDSLKAGEGKVIDRHGEKLAVYKDENGTPHAVSAVCTHMGCIIDWNKGDKTWDCPCHGSRFTKEGQVMNGPAKKTLEKKSI